jgi:hypothetical protein
MPASLHGHGKDLEMLSLRAEMRYPDEGRWRSEESKYDRIDRIASERR